MFSMIIGPESYNFGYKAFQIFYSSVQQQKMSGKCCNSNHNTILQ